MSLPPKTFSAGGVKCPFMNESESVLSESVHPENLVNTVPQKPMKKISPNFGRRCI